MAKPKVFATVPLDDRLLARLAEVCEVSRWTGDGGCPADVVEREVADTHAVVGYTPFPASLMDKAPRLRVIATPSVGFDHIDVAAATERGIVVTHTPDVLTDTTADLAFALMLAVARRIGEAERHVRAGLWGKVGGAASFLGRDVHHSTLGVVGLGRIGAAVAERALGFKMRVLYYDFVRREDLEQRFGYQYVDFDSLLRESDFVSLHVPLMPSTRGMMGAAQFALMKPTAFLINAARGPIVDERALIAALREGRIAGAGLDVFDREPTDPENPLLKMENVVAVPHIGSATIATRRAMAELAADNAMAVLQGRPPLTPVNPEVLSRLRP
ncbi:MAG: 2-hydroxyacid dehydrogenase [Sphingomonadaceae bacterium]